MIVISTVHVLTNPTRVRWLFWSHPEWWTYGLSALGWWVLAQHSVQFSTHGMHHHLPPLDELIHWLLMVCAMMVPIIATELRAAAFASPWARRHRAIAAVLLGYSSVWLLTGLPVVLLRGDDIAHTYALPMVAFCMAAIWQFVPLRMYALSACHRSPIPGPDGWRADIDCMRYGIEIGVPCALSGWPLMAACAFSGHALVVMIVCTVLSVLERHAYRPRSHIVAIGALAFATYYGLLSFGS